MSRTNYMLVARALWRVLASRYEAATVGHLVSDNVTLDAVNAFAREFHLGFDGLNGWFQQVIAHDLGAEFAKAMMGEWGWLQLSKRTWVAATGYSFDWWWESVRSAEKSDAEARS